MSLIDQHKLVLKRIALCILFLSLIFIITNLAIRFASWVNPTTAAFSFLILVILAAIFGGLTVAIITSIVSTLSYNYFFLQPVGTFRIAEFNDWIALFVFLFSSILISRLTASTRQNARESEMLRKTMKGLKEFGAKLLSIPGEEFTLTEICREVVRIFSVEYCSIHVYTEGKWHHFTGSAVNEALRRVEETLLTHGDRPTGIMELIDEHGLGVRYARIQKGTQPFAVLVVKSELLPGSVIGTIGYMIGVRLMEILEERHTLHLNADIQ